MEERDFLVRISWMYYIEDMSQQEIADYFGLSRVKITRLLQKARNEGIVSVQINDKLTKIIELEDKVRKKFGLKQAFITPSPKDEKDIFKFLGKGIADFLSLVLKHNIILGIGWGRTINAAIPFLNQLKKFNNVRIIALTGGQFTKANVPNPIEIIYTFGRILGGECYYPLIPALLPDSKTKESLTSKDYHGEWYDFIDKTDVAIAGIGVVTPDANLFQQYDEGPQDAVELMNKGAVGDIVNEFFDINGNLVKHEISRRIFTIGVGRLKRIPISVGVAGGKEKIKPILGALRGHFINTLITDENTALELLKTE
ncbi:MAG: hypothetical protein DRP54_00070 [Spirochaetes bacterium]|nr:MAG: hypothetical protein DRP54_00070 [Spirochaetota bacterium]